MGVTECVDLESDDVRWQHQEVLCRRCDHVPWVKVQKGHEEVDPQSGCGGDDEVSEDVVSN